MENYERECAEKELLLKLQETEDAVKDGKGWLNLNETAYGTTGIIIISENPG